MNTEIIENTLLTLINEFKKDEEEKYNAVSNTIYSIHKSFLYEEELKTNKLNEIFSKIKIIMEEVKNEMKKFLHQFCIFDVVNLQRHENYNSNLLAEFLKINIENEATKLSFVKDFLIYLNDKFKWGYYGFKSIEELEEINHSDIRIRREEYAGSRRIDLFISYKKDFAIIIENKIYAGEQDNQLDDYYQNKKKDNYKKLYMIFLTPSGYEPYTLSEESKKELGNNFQTLKHSDIALWLENILENEKYSFLHDSNILFKDNDNKYIKDYRLLKSAMIQTIYNANMISNNTKELDMTKEKIRTLLEDNIFKDIQTVEEAEEYKKIFNSVIDIINEKEIDISLEPILFFTDKVIKYLNENSDDKSYYYKKIDEITKCIKEDPYTEYFCHNIKYNLNNYNADILLEYHYESGTFQFSIYTDNEKSYKKLKNKESSIKEIFSNFEEGNPYVYYIDTEKDSPEEIAEAMIKLYNLLKENL
ncbi:PD-(D/E)XK nuclease family protein [Brachyspira pulli]|uniref:PDDEXK-like family protein n=1 Tax=Brachyspira pulli TaxID=310721 RepID=UPI003AAD1197